MNAYVNTQMVRAGLVALSLATAGYSFPKREKTPPNFVVIFLDDSGWADFEPFGTPPYTTPAVRKLATEGCRYNQFYVPQGICSASRAALLTGCYPGRTGVGGALNPGVRGLGPEYETIAEMLKKNGYATAVFGKWHVGDQPETRPDARGFDESCGLMYSNDMWKHNPNTRFYDTPLHFWENGEVKIEDVSPDDQKHLTKWYTEHAVDFIHRHKDQPFFLYVPHSMSHVPLYCSKEFEGRSGAGLYGDVMQELDWSVAQIEKALKKAGVENETLVLFTSDNGPWSVYGNHAGKTPFREAKATSFDGGTRSACIVKYPGRIKPGTVSDKPWCSIDILPTLAGLADAELPQNPIDGKDVFPLISGESGAENPHAYYAFSLRADLESVMSSNGRWKLHLPHSYRHVDQVGHDGVRGTYKKEKIERSLFDLRNDPYETTNLIGKYPEVASKMEHFAEEYERQFSNK